MQNAWIFQIICFIFERNTMLTSVFSQMKCLTGRGKVRKQYWLAQSEGQLNKIIDVSKYSFASVFFIAFPAYWKLLQQHQGVVHHENLNDACGSEEGRKKKDCRWHK